MHCRRQRCARHALLYIIITGTLNLTNLTGVNGIGPYFDGSIEVLIASDPIAVPLLSAACLPYQLIKPYVSISIVLMSSDDAIASLQQNTVDLAFYVGSPTPQMELLYLDTAAVFDLATGVALVCTVHTVEECRLY